MTNTLRGRFKQARQKWIDDEYGKSPVPLPQVFLDSFDSGYKSAQPTSNEIDELARRIAGMCWDNEESAKTEIAEVLREYLGGKK